MREHPIPQDITGYRFHIIGSMTLKQFGELAAGAITGLIIYSTNLPTPIKWPLIFFSVGLGAAAAFLPFEERPLDHWLSVFIGAMYRPTKFFWKRQVRVPEAFSHQVGTADRAENQGPDFTPARRERIQEYLASVGAPEEISELDAAELQRLQEISAAFATSPTTTQRATKDASQKPSLKVRVRSLHTTPDEVVPAAGEVVIYEQDREPTEQKHQVNAEQIAREIQIPATQVVATEQQHVPVVESVVTPQAESAVYVENKDSTMVEPIASTEKQSATFNINLPFPNKPTQPNKLVGMILTPTHELIPEAIVEVRDENNRVVRAVKSNALGQFFISTPLKNGQYSLHFEHDDYQFQPITITLDNSLVDPLEVRSAS